MGNAGISRRLFVEFRLCSRFVSVRVLSRRARCIFYDIKLTFKALIVLI